MIGKIVNVTETSSKFEWRNPADVGVIPKVEFNAKQMLKHVLISAGIKKVYTCHQQKQLLRHKGCSCQNRARKQST
jgi:hypothetical protein